MAIADKKRLKLLQKNGAYCYSSSHAKLTFFFDYVNNSILL